MVKVDKTIHKLPFGLPRVQIHFPLWEDVQLPADQLKGVFRGDLLFMRYRKRDIREEEKINTNPLLLFIGANLREGWVEGPNLMFFNKFPNQKGSGFRINTNLVSPFIETYRSLHFNTIYETKERRPFARLTRDRFIPLFGNKIGYNLLKYWRRYDIKKMQSVSNINIDTAEEVLTTTKPTFQKSLFKD